LPAEARRVLQAGARHWTLNPKLFLDAFKGCPAIDRLPADLKSRLERAAQQERDNPAKSGDADAAAPPPKPPKACAALAGAPETAKPAKP
jgi:hypothetical protein